MKNCLLLLLATFACLTACQEKVETPPTFADTIYFNGTILTMEGNAPETVQAVAIKDDKIIQIGSLDALEAVANDSTVLIDLEENTMLH